MAIFFQGRAAAGGCVHDRVALQTMHRVDVAASLRAREFQVSAVGMQSSAARLGARNLDFNAVTSEHSNGRPIQLSEGNAAYAADQKRDSPAPGRIGGIAIANLREGEVIFD